MSVGGTIVSAAEAREKQVVMAYQPHLLNHPTDVAGILGGLAVSGPGRQFLPGPMAELQRRGSSAVHLRLDLETVGKRGVLLQSADVLGDCA